MRLQDMLGANAPQPNTNTALIPSDMPPLPTAAIASLRLRRTDRLVTALWVICAALLVADLILPSGFKVLSIDVSSHLSGSTFLSVGTA